MVQLIESFQNQGIYLGLESVYATPVAASKRIKSVSAPLAQHVESEVFVPAGDTVPSLVVINDEWATVDATGKPDFNSMIYFMASLYGPPITTHPGTLAYNHQFIHDGRTPLNPVSYTALWGSTNRAIQSAGLIWTKYNMSVARTGIDFGASAIGKQIVQGVKAYPRNEKQTITITGSPAGGTFTLTYAAATTAAIQYNAASGAVQTALEALAGIGSGKVLVTGGPGPGTPWVVEFISTLAQQDVTAITATSSLTGGSSPAITITETIKGGTATDIEAKALFPGHFDIYLDPLWASLGSTKLLYCYDISFETPERIAMARPVNSTKSSDGLVEMENQEFNVDMTVGIDATAEALIDSLRAGSQKFLRLDAIGGLIETGQSYLVRHDMALVLKDVGAPQSTDGVLTVPISATVVRDGVSGKAVEANVKNTLPTL